MIFIKLLAHRSVEEILKELRERRCSTSQGPSDTEQKFRIHPDFVDAVKQQRVLMENAGTPSALWAHQTAALEKIQRLERLKENGFGLFMSPGTGKTRVMVEQLRYLYNKERYHLRTLIICPPVVVKQWREEILKYSKIIPQKIVCLSGSGKKRHETFMGHIGADPMKIFITNYETLLMPDMFEAFVGWGPTIIILDESHRIKNHAAKRTRQALRLSKLAKYKYILTGSPVLNSIEDIFPQIAFINPEIFPQNFFAFRHTYMYDKNRNMPKHKYFPDWKPKPDAEVAIQRKIADVTFKAKKEDCLTLPPFVRQRVEVEMSEKQAKAYEQMKRQFITFVNEEAVVAELAITKTLRMRQILSGFAKTDSDKCLPFQDNPRLEALSQLVEDIAPSEKIIIWAEFRENYNQIAGAVQKLGFNYKLLVGEQSQKEKEEAIFCFRSDGDVRVLISNPGAGGIGVNLVEASHMIYYSRSPNLEHDIQSEARAYRGGSERHVSVTRWDLVCPDTLDDVILEALKNKQVLGDVIVGWAKTLGKTGSQKKG